MDELSGRTGNVISTVRQLKAKNSQTIQPTSLNDPAFQMLLKQEPQQPQLQGNNNNKKLSIIAQCTLQKRISADLGTAKTSNETVDFYKPNNNISLCSPRDHPKRFSVDANKRNSISTSNINVSKFDRSNTGQPIKKEYKPYDYYNFRKIRKNKTDYQRNIMSNDNIQKYKKECFNIVSTDTEIMKLCTNSKILLKYNGKFNEFLEQNLFNKGDFWFRLEILMLIDIQESNTLKVFSNVKHKLPLKVEKEKFYKKEVKRLLEKIIMDTNYNDKINSLMKTFNQHITNIKQYEL
jgi:hypothetical protein